MERMNLSLNGEEKRQILSFSGTNRDYTPDRTIHNLFEEQARLTPNHLAVILENQKITYRELNERANRLAHMLKGHGIGPECIVGILVNRSIETIVGLLAILKAGGAYMPIDPDYPADRIEYMLKDTLAEVLIAPAGSKRFFAFDGPTLDLNDELQYSFVSTDVISDATARNLAYIIYTSGSTGNPKGIMVEHRNVLRLVKNTNYFDFSMEHRLLQTGAIVFDASTFEIWGSLLNGLTLCMLKDKDVLDLHKLKEAIVGYDITSLFLTTALFHYISEHQPDIFRTVNTLLVGGEALSPKHANTIRRMYPHLRLANIYGPTENTTFSTYFQIEHQLEAMVPIGKPISNTSAYILDSHLQLVPIGVAGELCVGGEGVARGYLNRPDLTEAKFVDNPFVPGEKMYRTGDLARWLPDGNIEFIGRIDDQVKIRGYRVEPGEIEARLIEHDGIAEAVVAVKQDSSGNPLICAYFVGKRPLSTLELKVYLSQRLPDYFLPSYLVELESLPLTPNGKVDKKALPGPEQLRQTNEGGNQSSSELNNETEARLLHIWLDILETDRVGIDDDFFEAGGHSVKSSMMLSRIYKEFQIRLPLRAIFNARTIRELAKVIQEEEAKSLMKAHG